MLLFVSILSVPRLEWHRSSTLLLRVAFSLYNMSSSKQSAVAKLSTLLRGVDGVKAPLLDDFDAVTRSKGSDVADRHPISNINFDK